jgi:hypothetical protein
VHGGVDEDVCADAGSGKGWVTAEHRCCPDRRPSVSTEAARQSGRTIESSVRIGRSLRAAHDDARRRQVIVDCDVLQADGGSRTASICGVTWRCTTLAWSPSGADRPPLHPFVGGQRRIVGGLPVLDLPYVEDSRAEVDMNVVMLAPAGGEPFRRGAGHAEAWPSPAVSSTHWLRRRARAERITALQADGGCATDTPLTCATVMMASRSACAPPPTPTRSPR